MRAKAQHVVPNGRNWSIRKAGSSRATKTFATKQEAIKKAREIASNKERNSTFTVAMDEFANATRTAMIQFIERAKHCLSKALIKVSLSIAQ